MEEDIAGDRAQEVLFEGVALCQRRSPLRAQGTQATHIMMVHEGFHLWVACAGARTDLRGCISGQSMLEQSNVSKKKGFAE